MPHFFGARRKIKFNSNALSLTRLQPSPILVFPVAPNHKNICSKVLAAAAGTWLSLCVISVALEDSLEDRHSVLLRVLCLFQSLFLQGAPTSCEPWSARIQDSCYLSRGQGRRYFDILTSANYYSSRKRERELMGWKD